MKRAREAANLSQEQLGDLVGTSQVNIWKIETGASGSSTFILPICRALDIPEPAHFASEERREWDQLFEIIRRGNPEQYEAAIGLIRSIAKAIAPADEVVEKPKPPSRH